MSLSEHDKLRVAAVWFAWSVLGWVALRLSRAFLRQPAIDWLAARGERVSLAQIAAAAVGVLALWVTPPAVYTLRRCRRADNGARAG
jgi:hypothetical protein